MKTTQELIDGLALESVEDCNFILTIVANNPDWIKSNAQFEKLNSIISLIKERRKQFHLNQKFLSHRKKHLARKRMEANKTNER